MAQEITSGWLRIGEAAHRLQLSPQRVRQLIDQGKLAAIRTPLGRLVQEADCTRLQQERAQASL